MTTKKQHIQQECIPVGCVPSAAVAAGGGGGGGESARVCVPGCVSAGGGGVYLSLHWDNTPSVNRMTDREV